MGNEPTVLLDGLYESNQHENFTNKLRIKPTNLIASWWTGHYMMALYHSATSGCIKPQNWTSKHIVAPCTFMCIRRVSEENRLGGFNYPANIAKYFGTTNNDGVGTGWWSQLEQTIGGHGQTSCDWTCLCTVNRLNCPWVKRDRDWWFQVSNHHVQPINIAAGPTFIVLNDMVSGG